MGRPSFRSDVFSVGLILYRMLAGVLPEWPYRWPLAGADRLQRRLHPDLIAFLKKSLELDPYKRFADARAMLESLRDLKGRAVRPRRPKARARRGQAARDWRVIQEKEFLRQYKGALQVRHACGRCHGPVSEFMKACPWCGSGRKTHRDETSFPAACPRCKRGVKLDWRFCPWCYGASIGPLANRTYSDRRYDASCSSCRNPLMPHMSYCPWCRAKVKRKWKLEGSRDRCKKCGWGVAKEFWSTCPWCTASLNGRTRTRT